MQEQYLQHAHNYYSFQVYQGRRHTTVPGSVLAPRRCRRVPVRGPSLWFRIRSCEQTLTCLTVQESGNEKRRARTSKWHVYNHYYLYVTNIVRVPRVVLAPSKMVRALSLAKRLKSSDFCAKTRTTVDHQRYERARANKNMSVSAPTTTVRCSPSAGRRRTSSPRSSSGASSDISRCPGSVRATTFGAPSFGRCCRATPKTTKNRFT